jgi:hypothetical protein
MRHLRHGTRAKRRVPWIGVRTGRRLAWPAAVLVIALLSLFAWALFIGLINFLVS